MKLIPNLHDIDQHAIRQAGIPAERLMESGGLKVAQAVQAQCDKGQQGAILCGPGNNGGDGFVCARKLYEAGFQDLKVIYTGQDYRNEALANLEKLMLYLPIPLVNAREQSELAIRHMQEADFLVDALFGSGLARPLIGLEARLVEAINARQRNPKASTGSWVLAVDLPSGIDGASGQILGCAVQADATVTLAAAKPGLYLQPGKSLAGAVSLVDIGIPARFVQEDESPYRLITPEDAQAWLPLRLPDSHKYRYGHVLVIAGSQAMPGAAILCSEAAMSAGAGLVTLAAPSQVFQQLQLMPEIMRLSLPDAAQLGEASVSVLVEALASQKYNTVVLGPGLGRTAQTASAVMSLLNHLKNLDLPVIIDADGLHALSNRPFMLNEQFILTPHVGEAARLLGIENQAVSDDLLGAAAQLRAKYGAQIVLKSASTVIATLHASGIPGEPAGSAGVETHDLIWITPTGNPGMATAGSGDVLSGVVAAMAAQRQAAQTPVGQAAPLGVYLHGLAGDAAAESLTPYGMRASSITQHLPQAFRQVLTP
jgi:hydroxyethylthiazole kinase-like uncharacterized protein yjeF